MTEISNKNEQENLRKMQLKMLELLLYFKSFCEQHQLKFYLCGGCLIGTIRHKGFVPWDDDIDCFMPRKDYEDFKVLWEKYGDKQNYTYCRTDENHIYHDCAASLRDNNTTFINRHSVNEDICHGLALEIMPIDGCPNSLIKRAIQVYHAMVFSLFNAQRLPDNKGNFIRLVSRVIYLIVPSKKVRYKIWKNAEKKMSQYKWNDCDYVTELIGSIRGMRLKHPKKDFDKVLYKEFEGHKMPIMAGYHRYLSLIWGDYMKLPPVEKRKVKHDAVYIDINESYKKYKGIYYCTNRKWELKE